MFNVLIIGSGRMGQRHAQGIVSSSTVKSIHLTDVNPEALATAQKNLASADPNGKIVYALNDDLLADSAFDVIIIASTATDRFALVQKSLQFHPKYLLIEKPLGQSLQQVQELIQLSKEFPATKCFVNLNMRLYDCFLQLKNDLQTLPQLKGEKTITINTGTIGIGANGIHYLDLIAFLLDASRQELISAEIEKEVIPSGRGNQFGDFGGWAVIKYYDNKDHYLGKALLSLSNYSTAFGSWEILAPHGRIFFNEVEQKRINHFRKEDSTLPHHRYAGDYMQTHETLFSGPFLGDLTKIWLEGLNENKWLLPQLSQSLGAHQLMFDWLAKSKTHQKLFPIT